MHQDDVVSYRKRLLSNDVIERRAVSRSLATLSRNQRADFIWLCHHLLDDASIRVRSEILWRLYRYGDHDDTEGESKALTLLAVPALRPRAILAIGTIGTRSAHVALLKCVEAGEMFALRSLAHQARTEARRDQALGLTRQWLFADVFWQRDEALEALPILSSAEAEEEYLLAAYTKYGDEGSVWALGHASARMLPILYDLRARWSAGCAQYNDVQCAIWRMEDRIAHGMPDGFVEGLRTHEQLLSGCRARNKALNGDG